MSIVRAALFTDTGGSPWAAGWLYFPGRVALFDRADGSKRPAFTIAKTAIVRKPACFIWDMMTERSPEGYHTVLPALRLLRTADAASALTLSARCDTG